MIKKISVLWLLLFLFVSYSYAANWTYYQVRKSVYNNHKSTINTQLFNNNLSSSYYIDKWVLSNWDNVPKKEWDILVFVVEQWEFQPLTWFTVTDYDWYRDYFTAIYSGKNFAVSIYYNFRDWLLSVSRDSSKLYKNITVLWVTKTIKIASTNDDMDLLNNKIKISWWYVNTKDPILSPLSYTAVYFTKYYYDVHNPKLGDISYKDEDWNSYDPSTDWWINKSVKYKIRWVDRPVWIANSWPKKTYFISMVDNQQLVDDPLKVTTEDNLGNKGTEIKRIAIPIDKQKPVLKNNRIKLSWNVVGLKYDFYTDSNDQVILADKYNIKFTLKDPWTNCESLDTNCKQVSWIKKISLKVDWVNTDCTKTLSSYNPSYIKKNSDIENIFCNIDFTQDKNYTLNLHFEDDAWNFQDITWNLNVKPGSPDPDKSYFKCTNCPKEAYATNNDTYNFNFTLKDHWGNAITAKVNDIKLTNNSYIDKDIYDWNNTDDWNIIEKVNMNLWNWNWSFAIRSIVPWNIKDEFKFMLEWYDDISPIDFGNKYIYKKPITTWAVWVEDSSWNNIPFTWMVPNTKYVVKFTIKENGFNDNSYSYEINKDDLKNSIKLYPDNYYKVTYFWNTKNNKKNSWENIKTVSFVMAYEFVGSWAMDKELWIKFNPSIQITNNGKEGKYWIWTYKFWNSNIKKAFPFKVIGYKSNVWNSSIIWEASEVNLTNDTSLKTNIRKKAFYLSNSFKNWEIRNWIFYKVWDYSLTSSEYNRLISSSVNTIILKNWNLKILTDIKKRLDIAVISDNTNYDMYSSTTAYRNYLNNWGNIIIWSNVSVINGLLFTDKSLFAWKTNGDPISPYSSQRGAILGKQLVFYWALISRNTIAWSIQKNWKYIMPWWKKVINTISNLKLALAFDLAFFRLGNKWYDSTLNKKYNEWNKENVLVIYNPDLRIHPYYLLK